LSKKSKNEEDSDVKCGQRFEWINMERLANNWDITSKTIDRTSRRVFPISFVVFNIVYWLTYTVFTNNLDG